MSIDVPLTVAAMPQFFAFFQWNVNIHQMIALNVAQLCQN